MSIEILSVSRKPTDWVRQALDDYLIRFPSNAVPKLTFLAPESGRLSKKERVAREGKSILSKLDQTDVVILLDTSGFLINNLELVRKLKEFSQAAGRLKLIIGGSEGVHESVKKRAFETWSLSTLVMPHKVVQVLLLEQLYRSRCIIVGHPYHRF